MLYFTNVPNLALCGGDKNFWGWGNKTRFNNCVEQVKTLKSVLNWHKLTINIF